jgi:starvation-inducible DNA-binding protein
MLEYARLSEQPGDVPPARDMVENLVADHETFIRQLREDTDVVGGQLDDVAIEDYYTQMIQDHQEMAWMLRAFLEGESL